jgi:transposase
MPNDIKHGDLTLGLPDELEVPPEALDSSVTLEALRKQATPRRSVGLVCLIAADLLERHQGRLRLDAHITPALLRKLGYAADAWDRVLLQIDELRRIIQKANAAADNAAHTALLAINSQIKAQIAKDPGLAKDFEAVRAYFGAKP